ncbi:hypothetical protein [Rhodospira trueperi]|uniref:Cytochrome c domain-containing protein n=1 Tax=Rhodospira trueperi TaxID=69960 RepID=A0A1G7GYJ4_9PROT|nr:hypothetical protein [Rhodospira trueperi]SDE92999.1 hypothetical protein SAMN05421720_11651 [Rhodospira trueperi]
MIRFFPDADWLQPMRGLLTLAMVGALGFGLAGGSPAFADDDDDDDHKDSAPLTGLEAYYQALDKEPAYASSHEEAVAKLVQNRDIAIPYDYIATLMRIPNAFGEGAACVVCHSSSDPETSYRGLDLTTCEGIKTGATQPPARPLFEPGNAGDSSLRRYLRNNRMPYGVPFDAPRDTANIQTIKMWIDDGALNDDVFQEDVLPLFKDPMAFGGFQPCTDCHMSNQEPPSFHELDLTSFEGIMLGADAIAHAAIGEEPTKIVIPGDSAASPLYQRLIENRMPAGIEPSENRDHPNIQILMQWIDQGAKCE